MFNYLLRKVAVLLPVLTIVFLLVTPVNAANISLQGEIVQGRFLVPMRGIFEALGARVFWDGDTRTVSGVKDDTNVKLSINSSVAAVNDQTIKLDVPAALIDGRTFVPARFVSESLGAEVSWDGESRVATISQKGVLIRVFEEIPIAEKVDLNDDVKDEDALTEDGLDLPSSEQYELAFQLFEEIYYLDMWDVDEMENLYLRVIAEAPDTSLAEEAYWRLSNMYMRAFTPPRHHDAASLLEQYLERYPESTFLDEMFSLFAKPGLTVVKNRLMYLYLEIEATEKLAVLYDEFIPDPAAAGSDQVDHLVNYALAMEQVDRLDDAVIAYRTYLERKEDPSSWIVDFILSRLQDLDP